MAIKKEKLGTSVGAEQNTSPQKGKTATNPSDITEQKKTKRPKQNDGLSEMDAVQSFAEEQQKPMQDEMTAVQSFGTLQSGRKQLQGMKPMEQPRELPPVSTGDDAEIQDILGASKKIGVEQVREAMRILEEYKAAKVNLDEQRIRNEEWYRLRHWELFRQKEGELEPKSAWLFNAIAAKHADAMDNFPTCNVLPRAKDDELAAETLSQVIPCVLERNHYEEEYSTGWWDKLKNGTAGYGITWDNDINNGEGDVSVKYIDILKVFWQPGITDIQRSRNLFIVDFIHRDELKELYPQLDTDTLSNVRDFRQYVQQDNPDHKDMIPVIDWYYKKVVDGRSVLHYCKFVEENVLFATENEAGYTNGLYHHGQYPIVLDVMYPMQGTPYGFGLIDLAKDNQLYIDQLYKDIMTNAEVCAVPRYLVRQGAGVNVEQFLDPKRPIVEVEGSLDEKNFKVIDYPHMPTFVMNVLTQKIDELKETTANRDVNSGSTASGVTAASAISALQEAGNKQSRDIIEGGYRAFKKICTQVMELIRQFYQDERCFRITGKNGRSEFISISSATLQGQPMPEAYPGQDAAEGIVSKQPVFDIEIEAEKASPYQRLSNNTFIMELYSAGFFAPENAQASIAALDAMEFEGKDSVMAKVQEGQTLLNVIQQMQMQMQIMQQQMSVLTGQPNQEESGGQQKEQTERGSAGNTAGGRALRAQRANHSEQTETRRESIRKNATVSMNRGGGGTETR